MRLSEQSGVPLTELSVAQLQSLHPAFGDDVLAVWDYEQSVDARDATGGTSRRRLGTDRASAWASGGELIAVVQDNDGRLTVN
ncbi:MAG: hypothetical protein R2856_03745 [Caldilineaceae bacterium]